MTTTTTPGSGRGAGAPFGLSLALIAFTLTTFLSAVLLFSVQPMFAKMVLPLLGGSPSVWAVALVFFQGMLLLGYGYAHLLVSRVPLAKAGFVHGALCLAAFLSLPIAIPAGFGEPPAGNPSLWQLSLFTVAIGLPFFAVSANAPLMQAWFARSGDASARDPYFLYAASNLGSLLSLLGYPLLLEPAFGLSMLAHVWTIGFAILSLALMGCFALVRRRGCDAIAGIGEGASGPEAAPTWGARLGWVGLALVPSALLTAFTTHIATDVASAPLIWVIPLALYLLTFVIVFRERSLVPSSILLPAHLVAVLLALLQLAQVEHDTWFYSAGFGVAAFFTSTLVAHRTLYEARPAARHLTEFYMWMSLGGVIGGLFAALLAPQLFSEVFEYPLLLAATFACRPGALAFKGDASKHRAQLAVLALGLIVVFGFPLLARSLQFGLGGWGSTAATAFFIATATLALWKKPDLQLILVMLLCLVVVALPSMVHRGQATRSYFGVYRVVVTEDKTYHLLQHGTTLHGAQRVRDDMGNAQFSTQPMTYYHPKSPMTSSVLLTSMVGAYQKRDPKIGVIGLGAGSLACHSASGETWRFFEIDQVVVDIARSDAFTFLKSCQPKAPIIVGDARLTFAKEEDKSYDLIIVDAFSSDAIPMHLMTADALTLYASKLRPDGVVVLHISNRYLDLEGVLASTLPVAGPFAGFTVENRYSNWYQATGSVIVIYGPDKAYVDMFRQIPGARDLKAAALKPWTDDASDILGPFLSRYRSGQ